MNVKDQISMQDACSFCGSRGMPFAKNNILKNDVFICRSCAAQVIVMLDNNKLKKTTASKEITPLEMIAHLDKHVIGQEHAKKVLSVAVHNHYKRINDTVRNGVEIEKSNILLMGPTGCGKTLLVKTLARKLNVPIAIGDATTLTQAGYVGDDVENLLLKLLIAADWDVEVAERGIIFIDEVDKIAKTSGNVSITRDVSGEGVQQCLLKLVEGSICNVSPQGGRKKPNQECIRIDTTNILFICGGAFNRIYDILERRTSQNQFGFGSKNSKLKEPKISTEDFVEFGMIPEFIGRFPIKSVLKELSEFDFVRILTEPKSSIINQYIKIFKLSDVTLSFEQDAIKEIAKMAKMDVAGVRSLRVIVEEILLDYMVDLKPGSEIIITKDFISKFFEHDEKLVA